MNDYSDYLNRPGKFDAEEKAWLAHPEIHDEYARVVNKVIGEYNIKSVLEIGCGTGEVAKRLSVNILVYIGWDLNSDCLKLARDKNPQGYKIFQNRDVRSLGDNNQTRPTLTLAFAFLKHFGLHEWSNIFNKIASLGDYFIFNMPIATETTDNGTEFHHILKSKDELLNDISAVGFSCLDIIDTVPVEPIFVCKRNNII